MDEDQIPGQTQEESTLKKQFTTVTPFSKYLALSMLVALPFIGFALGLQFQSPEPITSPTPVTFPVPNLPPTPDPAPTPTPDPTTTPFPTSEPTPTPDSTPTPISDSNQLESQEDESSNEIDLIEILEQFDNFPQQPCPTPEGRYHTEKYDFIRTDDAGVIIIQYPGTNVDTVRLMTSKVQEKMSELESETLIEVYIYEVIVFSPNSGAYSAENDAIRCFNLAS